LIFWTIVGYDFFKKNILKNRLGPVNKILILKKKLLKAVLSQLGLDGYRPKAGVWISI
jgi:hypothetical protein